MNIFTIRDDKAEAFNRPFFSPTRMTAMREISVGMQKDEAMSQFALDFSLWNIGTWDPASGRLTPMDPQHICGCAELKETE